MASWGIILWLIGLSAMTFFAVAWLLDISNRQRQLQETLEETYVDGEGHDLSRPLRVLGERLDQHDEQTQQLGTNVQELHTNMQELHTDTESVQADALRLETDLEQLRTTVQQMGTELDRLGVHLPHSVQAVGLIRFQAFSDYGGDQSFALALANTAGDGVVLSGIFAREGTRVYAKPLDAWASSYSLSFEEEEAISQAKGQLQ